MGEKFKGPVGYVLSHLFDSIKGIGALIRRPLMLLPIIMVSIVWFFLAKIRYEIEGNSIFEWLNFLTFAQGGMTAGLLGAVGGILGKTIVGGFVTRFFSPIFGKRVKIAKRKGLVKEAFKFNQAKSFALLAKGLGLGFIAYHFMTGNGSMANSMVGIMSFIAVFRALSNEDSFLIGFTRSFSRGRLPKERAAHFVLGLGLGFVISIFLSYRGLGTLCYTIGIGFFAFGLVFGILTRSKKSRVVTATILLIFTSLFPAVGSVYAATEWMEPFEAYGIVNSGPGSYTQLTNALNSDLPVAMKLTVVAAGFKYFDESVALSNPVSFTCGDGFVETVNVSGITMPRTEFSVAFTMERGSDGWNADYVINYNVNDNYTDEQGETGAYDNISNAYFDMAAIVGTPSYLYDTYVEDGYMYMTIPVEFPYGEFTLGGQLSSATQLFARVDAVKRSDGQEAAPSYTGYWEKIGEANYMAMVYRHPTAEKVPFDWEWGTKDGTFVNEVQVDGDTITHKFGEEGDYDYDYRAEFSSAPDRIKAEEHIVLDVIVDAKLNGGQLNQASPQERVVFAMFIKGERPDTYDVSVCPDSFFELDQGVRLVGNALQGNAEGEIMTLERILGTATGYAAMSTTYEWRYGVIASEPDTEIDEDWWSEWEEDSYDPWSDDYATEEEAMAINTASTLGAIIAAGAVAAGLGGFSGPTGSGGRKDYDPTDGTMIVTAPNGSQEIYRRNPETGDFEDSRGNTLNVDDLDRAHSEQRDAMEWSKKETERMQTRSDGDSEYWRKVNRVERMRSKLEKEGYGSDSLKSHMAKRLDRLQKDIHAGKGFDEKAYQAVRDAYGKYQRGDIADKDALPGTYTESDNYKDAFKLSFEEAARGESGKAIALRVATAIVTGGTSEFGFETAKAGYTIKDYVDNGGDSWNEAVSRAVLNTIVDEGIGRVVGGAIGFGGRILGKGGSIAKNLVSKTKIGEKAVKYVGNSADAIGDFLSTDLSKTFKNLSKQGTNSADDVAKKIKSQNAAKAIKEANQQLDDSVKKTIAKEAPQPIKKAPIKNDYEVASKKFDDLSKKADEEAEKAIENFKKQNPEKSARDELFEKGKELGSKKVDELQKAHDALKKNPFSENAKDAYDEALRKVQQDKYAMNAMNDMKGADADALRETFNTRNAQYNEAAIENTKVRVAAENEVDPSRLKTVKASNDAKMSGRTDASRTAQTVDPSRQTTPDFDGGFRPDDMTPQNVPNGKSPFDLDVTQRIDVDGNGNYIDLPKSDVERIYQQELYKVHHKGKLPKTTIDGREVLDEKAIKNFADEMDHTVADRTSPDAYGRGDSDFKKITDNASQEVREYDDITSVSGTMEYKSNEWFKKGADLKDAADKLPSDLAEELLIKAESMDAEGIRQLTKQFNNQTTSQVKAAMAAGQNIKVPDKLFQSIKVLEKVKDGKLTVSQAEKVLASMNTSIDQVVKQHSAIMESIAKFGK